MYGCRFRTPLGEMVTVIDPTGAVARLEFARGRREEPDLPAVDGTRCAEVMRQLQEYFDGTRREFDLGLNPEGTAFQRAVWRELVRVPYGSRVTYGQLARQIGRPAAVRAVGAANGANPIAIVIPCHRVVGSDGSLTGYGGGLPLKQWLLDHEAGLRRLPLSGVGPERRELPRCR
ncbi:MAG TPA: methylated-DNA--[protein]-cysteine S-methyltransferase [Thermoanaerobaculia bacterium]|nr:methylated-DNA--[protein]-cysteine S-methyltransferase [Thermoanaerobaculia bacterium]